jgi:hypothetical protein
MLTRTKSAILFSALAACAVVMAEDPTPSSPAVSATQPAAKVVGDAAQGQTAPAAPSSSIAAAGGSAQPLSAWVVPAAVAAAIIKVGIVATNEDPLLQPSSH